MNLIVGLGNPGSQYAATRHNAGFMVLDHVASTLGVAFVSSPWQADIAEARIGHHDLLLLKPMTYMNRSGGAVAPVLHGFDVAPARMVVIHDDIDLPMGRVKLVARGGDGGHRGIRSIIDELSTAEFPRVKVGVGRPVPMPGETPVPVASFVLSAFSAEERQISDALMGRISTGLSVFVLQGIEAAIQSIHSSPSMFPSSR